LRSADRGQAKQGVDLQPDAADFHRQSVELGGVLLRPSLEELGLVLGDDLLHLSKAVGGGHLSIERQSRSFGIADRPAMTYADVRGLAMNPVRRLTAVAVILVVAFGVHKLTSPTVTAVAAAPLPEPQFRELLTTIRPQPGEDLFDSIPWQTSLWDARTLAAKEGKPILLWEMDGHPLGCG
jgi:hypothetical protein